MIEDEMEKNFLYHQRTINAVLPPKINYKNVLHYDFISWALDTHAFIIH